MITSEEKTKFEHVASLSAWDVAQLYGCDYSGDCNPLEHGGFFFDPRDWEAYGYANCVEFWHDYENDCLVVQPGTVHKPNDDKMKSAFQCIGIAPDAPERELIACQVEAARSYCGIEPDGTSYPALKNFKLDDWQEWRIWRSIDQWLRHLGE